jgi:hypothetical protein
MQAKNETYLEVLGRVTSQLEHLGTQVLEDGGAVDGGRRANAVLGRDARLQVAVDTANRELCVCEVGMCERRAFESICEWTRATSSTKKKRAFFSGTCTTLHVETYLEAGALRARDRRLLASLCLSLASLCLSLASLASFAGLLFVVVCRTRW